MRHPLILQLDAHGTPQSWLDVEAAANRYATSDVVFELGDPVVVLHGGYNALTGRRSTLEIAPIVFTRGIAERNLFDVVPQFSRRKLFRRDRHLCAYCGRDFPDADLTVEHRLPVSRGGATDWLNCVTACRRCNQAKGNRTPEEARLELVYAPYVPSLFEDMILRNRAILADQMDFLVRRLPTASRLRSH